jgi:uroporphyrinogen-III synthase
MIPASANAAASAPGDRIFAPTALSGLRVAITRNPGQAAALASALRTAGAEPVLVPLIDFECASDQEALRDGLRRLTAGAYDWLVVTSSTTVAALQRHCAEAGIAPTDLVPAGTRVAAVGAATGAALTGAGLPVDLIPETDSSAGGLAAIWPDGPASVLLPQSDLAAPRLREELTAKGAAVDAVTAYRTVDYPARPGAALTEPRQDPAGSSLTRLDPQAAAGQIAAGTIQAVLAASGSAAAAVARLLAPLPPSCLLIAIGEPTREAAQRAGLTVAATAAAPNPEGIVDALRRAVTGAGFRPAPRTPSAPAGSRTAPCTPLSPAVRPKEHS